MRKRKPSVFKVLDPYIMKKQEKLFYNEDNVTLKTIIRISELDIGLLKLLLLNIGDFETCFATVLNSTRRPVAGGGNKCSDANHDTKKKCCNTCKHTIDNNFCEGCFTSKHLCKDDKFVCCSKCTLCVHCSKTVASPPCDIQSLRFAIYIIAQLRNLNAHTSEATWQHISNNTVMPEDFKFCGNTSDDMWKTCKDLIKYVFKYLKDNNGISQSVYEKKVDEINHLEHLSEAEVLATLATLAIEKSHPAERKKLRISLELTCSKSSIQLQNSSLNSSIIRSSMFKKFVAKGIDSDVVAQIECLLRKILNKEIEEHLRDVKMISKDMIFCDHAKIVRDEREEKALIVIDVCVNNVTEEKMIEAYQNPKSEMSKNLWEHFHTELVKIAGNKGIMITVERTEWKLGSILIKLEIRSSSGKDFHVCEKEGIVHIINNDLENSKSLFGFKFDSVLKENARPEIESLVMHFSIDIIDKSIYQTLKEIQPEFEEKLKQGFETIKESLPSLEEDFDVSIKLIHYEIEDSPESIKNKTTPGLHQNKMEVNLLNKIRLRLKTMINSRKEILKWLNCFIKDVKTQEIAINSVKTASAAVGVVSFFGLFTPFAPLAAAGMVGAGVGGAATTIYDSTSNKVKYQKLQKKLDIMKTEDTELKKLSDELDVGAIRFSKELNISKDEALLFYLVGVPKVVAQTGVQVINGTITMVKVLPHLKAATEAMKLGASFGEAFKISGTVFQGVRLSVTSAEGASALGTTLAISLSTKIFGGFGAVIGVADVIYSWATTNPNRALAEALVPRVEKNIKTLKELKASFDILHVHERK